MFKKIILTSAIITAATVTQANPAPYVGAGLGIVANTSNDSAHFGSFRGVPVNVFAGYGGMVNPNFYLAGEVGGTVTTAAITDNHHNSLKTTYGYGASVIPGVMLSDHTLAFARVGVVKTRFSNVSGTRTGGQIGAGLQTSLTQNVDLRGEYDFTAYKKVSKYDHSTAPRSDAFNVGLIYKFD